MSALIPRGFSAFTFINTKLRNGEINIKASDMIKFYLNNIKPVPEPLCPPQVDPSFPHTAQAQADGQETSFV